MSQEADGRALEELEEQADAAADFLDELLARMDIDAIAEPNPQGSHMYVDIVDGPEEDMSLLIGRHGQTLEAIQELTRMAVSRKLDTRVRVIVDVEDYRKRREARLEDRARELAQRVAGDRQRGRARADELATSASSSTTPPQTSTASRRCPEAKSRPATS